MAVVAGSWLMLVLPWGGLFVLGGLAFGLVPALLFAGFVVAVTAITVVWATGMARRARADPEYRRRPRALT